MTRNPAKTSVSPPFYLKPVAPIAGPNYVVDTIGPGKVDWGTGMVRARGTGILDPKNPNKGQARVIAERDAIIDAQKNLLTTVQEVRINGEIQVKDFMTQSDINYNRVDGVLSGARLASEPKYDSALGTIQIELEIKLYDKNGLSDAVAQPGITTKAIENLAPREKELLQRYSSVVFDASGTGLKPALFPKIYDKNGSLLFDTGTYVDTASQYGKRAVQYIKSMDKIIANPDLKSNPLIIKIKEMRGKLGGDIVIFKENADQYKWLKNIFPFFLKTGRTFILARPELNQKPKVGLKVETGPKPEIEAEAEIQSEKLPMKVETKAGIIEPVKKEITEEPAIQPISHTVFQKLLQSIENEEYENNRLEILKSTVDKNYFTCNQLIEILKFFDFDFNKIAICRNFYPKLVDKDNFDTVYPSFNFSSSKTEIKEWVEKYEKGERE